MTIYDKNFFRNEKGMTLVLGLMIIMVLTLLGATAVMMTTTDLKITGNYRTGETAFYAAEAGIEEARGRLRKNAANPISDSMPATASWESYIGTAANAAAAFTDYQNGDSIATSLMQNSLEYVVQIKHKLNSSGNPIYINPDKTQTTTYVLNITVPCYVARSLGKYLNSTKMIKAEFCRLPPIDVPGALYVKAITTIKGTSTNILGVDPVTGLDPCGGGPGKNGIASTLAPGSVTYNGSPVVNGPANPTGSTPQTLFNQPNLDVQSMIDSFKSSVNYAYNVGGTVTGMNWGTPVSGATLQNPSTCSVSNVVYYNSDVKLAGGTSGCGVLIIDGDLDVNGGFSWYGIVIVSGAIVFSGGGNKNITGGLMSGSSVDADIVGGNANIVYCSKALSDVAEKQPLINLTWIEENI